MQGPQTGDVVLFAGASGILDRLISWFTSSPYTHVGLVIRDPPGLPPGVHVIESSLEETPNEETGRRTLGVQIQPLSTILSAHGTAYIRRLRLEDEGADLKKKICGIESTVDGKPYDLNAGDWLRAELRVLDPRMIWEQQDNTFWCSALVSYFYVRLGLLPETIPWTLISPKEWGQGGAMEKSLIGCTLGPPAVLQAPPPQIQIPKGPQPTPLPPPAPRAGRGPLQSAEDN